MDDKELIKFNLEYNPFEPAASGAPVKGNLWLPERISKRLKRILDQFKGGRGSKPLVIVGEYGSGKTYILQWLYRQEFPARRIKAFYLDNPGVKFYDLADNLLKQIGRKNLAKSIWELADIKIRHLQQSFFPEGFEDLLKRISRLHPSEKEIILKQLQENTINIRVTNDEEIAYRLARMVLETGEKPYFEYQDFIASRKKSLVAEKEEAPYFQAIIRIIQKIYGVESIAFLIDEFEEISIQKQLSRKEAYNYLATIRRLINLIQTENLWLILSMTPDGLTKTYELESALSERLPEKGSEFLISESDLQLSIDESRLLVLQRLKQARPPGFERKDELFPFPDDITKILGGKTYSNARRLVKVCFHALESARNESPPFSSEYIKKIENSVYPVPKKEDEK